VNHGPQQLEVSKRFVKKLSGEEESPFEAESALVTVISTDLNSKSRLQKQLMDIWMKNLESLENGFGMK